MAKEQTPDYSSFEKYMHGALAERLYTSGSEQDKKFAPSALEVLAGSKGLNLGETAEGFVKGALASDEGVKSAINTYSGDFEKEIGKYSPADLVDWYNPVLSGLDDEEREKVTNYLGKFNETIREMTKKIKKASMVIESQKDEDFKGEYTPEQVSEANETLGKYQQISLTLNTLDKYKFESIRSNVSDEARKKDLKGLASKI